MKNIKTKLIATVAAAVTTITAVLPFGVHAAFLPAQFVAQGDWVVTTLGKNSPEWKIEAYKVDKGLTAWTELSAAGTKRRLYVFNGVSTQLLAEMPSAEWKADSTGFTEAVKGDFDVADGTVVWTMNDGKDREIYAWSGDAVQKISDNTYDDRHPVAGEGRIAWTSQPTPNGAYNLMVKDANGVKRLASWNVSNYAFSGKTLFWMNKNAGEDWFRVYRNDGFSTVAVGKGDDRPLPQYFTTDGKGSAAWEYSTKNWSYDKREIFLSYLGGEAVRKLQRDVPPNVTRIEDMDGDRIVVNIHDLLYTRLTENHSVLMLQKYEPEAIWRKGEYTKVRFADGGYVRPREPGANIPLVFHAYDRGEDFVSLEAVIQNRFDADGPTVAGAKVGGGVILFADSKPEIIKSTQETTDITVKNGDVAWLEGAGDSRMLKMAQQTVLVRAPYGVGRVAGRLVKVAGKADVSLMANDGNVYAIQDETVFKGWYKDFTSVQTVTEASMAAMPKGGVVLLNPAKVIIKTKNSPSIYAVDAGATLHWVSSEDALKSVYGANWKSKLVTVSDATIANYAVGNAIGSDMEYFATLARAVKTK